MSAGGRTLVVVSGGRAEYRQIQAALDAARPGDTVLVRAGTYRENLHLRSGVILQGEGPDRSRVVVDSGNALRAENVTDGVVLDLGVEGSGEGRTGVYLRASSVTLERCRVSGAKLSGVEAAESSHLVLRECALRGNQQAGVFVRDASEALLEDNFLEGNHYSSIAVSTQGQVTARGNTIRNNQQGGVSVYDGGAATLEGSLLEDNQYSGLAVRRRGRITARGNIFRNNEDTGVFVYEEGEALLEANLLEGNGLHGFTVQEGSQLTARRNTLVRHVYNGVWVREHGRAELEHNLITGCGREGVRVEGNPGEAPAASVVLRRNCLWNNNPDYQGDLDPSSDLHADPAFVDPEHGDFHLRPHSPCRGAALDGGDLGAFPFQPPPASEPTQTELTPLPRPLRAHLRSLPLSHATPPAPGRPAAWLRTTLTAGSPLPLALVRDLGALLTAADPALARPPYLPPEDDSGPYLRCLQRLAAHPLLREVRTWDLSDACTGVLLARLATGLPFPAEYAIPPGADTAAFARRLAFELEQADPAAIWQETPAVERPRIGTLFPPPVLAHLEANLRRLDRDEVRFLHRYGPRFQGAPAPTDLLDLFHLLDDTPQVRLALGQVLRLLPEVSERVARGGVQTYQLGGYAGLTSRGNLDSLVPTELAYPAGLRLHRLLNGEALYYGREGSREGQRELAYVLTQVGVEVRGDADVLARALTLALGQTLGRRGYAVRQSFAGAGLTQPEGLEKPGDVQRVLYYREAGPADVGRVLEDLEGQLREWREQFRGVRVFWVVSEHWDADDWEAHREAYGRVGAGGGQQAWFIRVKSGRTGSNGGNGRQEREPAAGRLLGPYRVVETGLLWEGRELPTIHPREPSTTASVSTPEPELTTNVDVILSDYAIAVQNERTHTLDYERLIPRGTRFPTIQEYAVRYYRDYAGMPEMQIKVAQIASGDASDANRIHWEPRPNGNSYFSPRDEEQRARIVDVPGALMIPLRPAGTGSSARLRVTWMIDAQRWLLVSVEDLETRQLLRRNHRFARLT